MNRALRAGFGDKKLFTTGDLNQRFRPMESLQFLAETKVFGIVFNPWKIVGWTGSLIFGLRFFIQWIASERAKRSVIPFGFWECSALGSLLLLSYFAIYRHDSVGVLSSAMPLPIYLRNLYFRYTHRSPKHPGNEPRPPD
ncbi:MAG: lipid-A-disaccharide synthase N-terminal domain-containing protein [Chthoniobacterales bacterium]